MTCATCGSVITPAAAACTVCDPWAVGPAQGQAVSQAAGLSGRGQKTPRWIGRILARPIPPEVVEVSRHRPLVMKYSVLVAPVVVGLAYIGLSTAMAPGDFRSLEKFRFLTLVPLALLLVQRTRAKKGTLVGWLAASLHHIRDHRPELGFQWIARMWELRLSRAIGTFVYPFFIVMVEVNLIVSVNSLDSTRLLFVFDGVGYLLLAAASWCQGTVVIQAHRKITGRLAE